MPHDVTMPQLGMAQDAGKIVSWLKSPGDAVSKGDALFEVETDKATMEVEAQADGFLTGVAAAEGDDVPVGQVIARISDSAEDDAPAPAAAEAAPEASGAGDLPEGHSVTMPQLGMAQDSGLLVTWLKAPGDEVAPEDVLFEVETDKSTMEVEAGRTGWLAATLAEAGEEVPVGQPVAIISDVKPDAPVARSVKDGPGATAKAEAPAKAEAATPAKVADPAPKAAVAVATGGRILASPKARRLALEQGLDLGRLAEAGHPQPFHVSDLEVLRGMPERSASAAPAMAAAARRLTARAAEDGAAGFAAWAAEVHGLTPDAVLAGLAGASLGRASTVNVAVERFGGLAVFAVQPGRALSGVAPTEDAPELLLRDLRGTRLASVEMGAEDVPVLTVTEAEGGLQITLECAAGQLDGPAAIRLLSDFAGRMEQPLRHLL
jgi:pyruvate dehydrogenase E2 component (dihydrolipoamide acetyltransferase)/2-oxoglutarate dehydrogenase E2 component (dihydrolipoamide succinyltransferase)